MKSLKLTTPIALTLIGLTVLSGCSEFSAPAAAEPVDVVLPDTLTVPGSTFAVGETLRVPGSAMSDGDDVLGREAAELGLTVTEVTWPGEAVFEDFDNGEDFADYEPVVIAYQIDSPADADLHSFILGDIYGVLANGDYAEELQGDFGFEAGGLGRDLDELCYPGGVPEPGTSELRCTVLLVPAGQTSVSVEWDALGFDESNELAADDPRSPYVSAPVILDATKP